MIPYIAVLIVLIVSVLFMVYKRVDGFEIGMVRITDTTTVETFVSIFKRLHEQNKALKKKLEASSEFDESLAPGQIEELGLQEFKDTKPVSEALFMAIEKETSEATKELEKIQKKLESGDITNKTPLKDGIKKILDMSEGSISMELINFVVNAAIYVSNNREAYINKNAKPRSSKKKSKKTKNIGGLDAQDLYDAITGTSQALEASEVSDEVEYEEAPEQTMASTKEMEDRIAKNVATQLKDSLLMKRSVQNPMEDISCPYASVDSNAVAQGRELTQAKPSSPDMSEYIRKDSIPCWNCSLP
jgi:hypothetical protein